MRKILVTLAAIAFSGGLAWATSIPYLTGPHQPSNMIGDFNNLINQINTSTGLVAAQPGPVASTATTAEQIFATTAIASGTLASPGQTLIIRCSGTTGANTNTKNAHLYFGAEEITAGPMATSGESWELELVVSAVTATANSVVFGRGSYLANTVTPISVNDTTDNLSNAVTAKCTGTQGTASAADMTMENFIVYQEK